MTAPTGFGLWIAYPDSLGAGGPSRWCDALLEVGADWVALRAGDGGVIGTYRDGHRHRPVVSAETIRALQNGGIKVYPWFYSRQTTWAAEVAQYRAFMDDGADGVIIDAEGHWSASVLGMKMSVLRAEATRFLDSMRTTLPAGTYMAHAPFPYRNLHGDFPYAEFDTACDGIMDQLYWTEINNRGAQAHIDAVDPQWTALADKRRPIGVTYGSERGGPPGDFRVADLDVFLDHYAGLDCISLYSLDAANPDAIARLKEKQRIREQFRNAAPMP
jgi:hypothetical protein